MADKLHIEVVYALPERQFVLPLVVESVTTVEQAIVQSGILALCKDIDLNINRVGIYSKAAKLSDGLQEGDRIEIYRELLAEPREIRRRRAAEQARKAKNK